MDGNLFIRAHKFFIKKLRLELWPVVLAGFISAVVTKQTEDETRVKPDRTPPQQWILKPEGAIVGLFALPDL
ncbi:MAG: hypothetical protein B7Z81_00665 [Acidocella sp. 20-61-6]|nr:MAG: hypothetical protein B7Z81_00665 [Acidocella sp. 20-61-6]